MTALATTFQFRLAAAVAAVLVTAATAVGSGQPAAAAVLTVRQGASIIIGATSNTDPFSVSPPEAGTVSNPSWVGNATFTASATFQGSATVCKSGPTCVDVLVVGGTAAAQGSFVPVAAPGPCVLITANRIVPFGDVELGGPFTTSPAVPNVAGCAPTSVRQDVLVQTSDAFNGLVTLSPACAGVTPATCVPAEGFYALGILDDTLIVGPTPTAWLDAAAGDFATRAPQLAVRMPSILAPTFVGSLFTFDVVFTAVAA